MPAPRFTPSLLDGETLDRLFVARTDELNLALAHIGEAAETGVLRPTMFVGPRGAGKTHLISLIRYRASQMASYGTKFVISWIDEDPYDIVDYDTLLDAVEAGIEETSSPVPGAVSSATIVVVLAENFDLILERLGDVGQRRLRARIEREADLLLITTAVRVSHRFVAAQRAPFYGFFNIVELKPFTLDEAILMLQTAARVDDDDALARRLTTTETRNRLAAIQQLAGGQPRMWATFSAGLTLDGLDTLFSTLISQFDELTPYYQQQLERLTPNELKAVLLILDVDSPMTVKQIAKGTGIGVHSLAPTLRGLVPHWLEARTGYLQEFVDRRRQYYQLAEPMARVYRQVKRARGKTIQLAVDFMTAWFTRYEIDLLAQKFNDPQREEEPTAMSLDGDTGPLALVGIGRVALGAGPRSERGQRTAREHVESVVTHLKDPAYLFSEQMGAEFKHGRALVPYIRDVDLVRQAHQVDAAVATLQHDRDASSILELPTRIANLVEAQVESTSTGMFRLNVALVAVRAGGGEEWVNNAVDALPAVDQGETRLAHVALACVRIHCGQHSAAMATLIDVFAPGTSERMTTREWKVVATTLSSDLLQFSDEVRSDLLRFATELVADDDLPELVSVALTVLSDDDERLANVIHFLSTRLGGESSDPDGLLRLISDRDGHETELWLPARHRIAWWRHLRGDHTGAMAELVELKHELSRVEDADIALMLEVRADLEGIRAESGDAATAIENLKVIIAESERLLGRLHPATLMFRSNMAYCHFEAGDAEGGLDGYLSLVADQSELLGSSHPAVLRRRQFIAGRAGAAGSHHAAAEQYLEISRIEQSLLGSASLKLPTRFQAASSFIAAGETSAAIEVLVGLLRDRTSVLGPADDLTHATEAHLRTALRRGIAGTVPIPLIQDTLVFAQSLSLPGLSHAAQQALVASLSSAIDPQSTNEAARVWALRLAQDWNDQVSAATTDGELDEMSAESTIVGRMSAGTLTLDSEWLAGHGIGGLAPALQRRLLRHLYSELEFFIGYSLSSTQPDDKLREFETLIDHEDGAARMWVDAHAPSYENDVLFQRIRSTMQGATLEQVLGEYSATKWLEVNIPSYREIVQRFATLLDTAVGLVAPLLNAATSKISDE